MSLEPKKNKSFWEPTATVETLIERAKLFSRIRDFFKKYHVVEVETPLLSHASVTDPAIESFIVPIQGKKLYLQTSPEFAMKRLLAAGMPAIYQITKSFRVEEIGHLHNPEFTMLEWYRLHMDHHQLMDEMEDFFKWTLNLGVSERVSYKNIFEKYVGIDPHLATIQELQLKGKALSYAGSPLLYKKDWLDLLFTHTILPHLQGLYFIYDFPENLAALARLREESPPVASRFEVYLHGVELANGFHELKNAEEQRQRFKNDAALRKANGAKTISMDERFLAALTHGLPDCAGVALGIDRLCMLALKLPDIKDVISFSFPHA